MESGALHSHEVLQVFQHVDTPNDSSTDEKLVGRMLDATADTDTNVVDFEADDPENPLKWSTWRKWTVLVLVSMMNTLGLIATVIIVPAAPQVLQEFRSDNALYTILLVSIWDLGEGFGPFFVAPLSELYGRMPVYHGGNVLAIVCSVAAALSPNISMLIAFRFLNGFVMTALTLSPSIAADLFEKEERGTAMSVAIGFQLIGPFVGPIVGGFIAERLGWRWTIWVIVISVGVVAGLSLLFCHETYQVKILQRKTERLKKETGNQSLRSKHQQALDATPVLHSLTRPLRMMFFSPIVFIISFYTALSYGLSYLILTTLTGIMESTYKFGQGVVGLAFLGCAIGNVAGMLFYGLTSDRYIKYKKAQEGHLKPEHRLLPMILGSITLPLGLFLYGWTLATRVQWIVPLIGTAIIGFSMLLSVLPTENYLVDVYELHGASAVAAGVILRAIFGALFPLAGPPLYSSLGLGWGNSVLAFVTIAFIPALMLLMRYGERIRASRRFHQNVGL